MRDAAKAIYMLDLVFEFFEDGDRWLRNGYHDEYGNRCMVGALQHIRKMHHLSGDPTRYYLQQAQRRFPRKIPVNWYNDECRNFGEVFEWILTARNLAAADLARQTPAAEQAAQPLAAGGSSKRPSEPGSPAAAGIHSDLKLGRGRSNPLPLRANTDAGGTVPSHIG